LTAWKFHGVPPWRFQAYRWLCGGVSMNYHSLADFRTAHSVLLDQLLAGGVASLVDAGLVALDMLAQDGLRVLA